MTTPFAYCRKQKNSFRTTFSFTFHNSTIAPAHNPGLTLTQEGVMEGEQNVALSGRVYALATAANGAIKPGDLLTTSEVPEHEMKAMDVARSHGTIIGKAMSSLEKGEGLVLVLVNLQ